MNAKTRKENERLRDLAIRSAQVAKPATLPTPLPAKVGAKPEEKK